MKVNGGEESGGERRCMGKAGRRGEKECCGPDELYERRIKKKENCISACDICSLVILRVGGEMCLVSR